MDAVIDISVAPPTAEAAKPSLVGRGRDRLAAARAAVGVPENKFSHARRPALAVRPRRHLPRTDVRCLQRPARQPRRRLTLTAPEIAAEQDLHRRHPQMADVAGPSAATTRARPEIETVYIPEADRGTLCISSQVGCTLTCSFCHTGTQRLVRNLEPEEIVGQILLARDRIGDWPGAAAPDDGGLVPTASARSPTSC